MRDNKEGRLTKIKESFIDKAGIQKSQTRKHRGPGNRHWKHRKTGTVKEKYRLMTEETQVNRRKRWGKRQRQDVQSKT